MLRSGAYVVLTKGISRSKFAIAYVFKFYLKRPIAQVAR
jgi:hypothetical protein